MNPKSDYELVIKINLIDTKWAWLYTAVCAERRPNRSTIGQLIYDMPEQVHNQPMESKVVLLHQWERLLWPEDGGSVCRVVIG